MATARVSLAALRKKRGFTLPQLAAECQKRQGGKGMNVRVLSMYLTGGRPIGDVHFGILCEVLRVRPADVYTSRYLLGARGEDVAA